MKGKSFKSIALMLALLSTFHLDKGSGEEEEVEYPPYDGWYNNFAHPEWGAADTALLRLLPHAYSDGVYAPSGPTRPNPLNISRIAFNGSTGFGSYRNRTALLVFFGQQLVEEILDAQLSGCPPEYFNIPIPKDHPEFDPLHKGDREIPFLRTRHDQRTGYSPNVPREQLNEVSSYFDGSLMYGPNKAWADTLRLFDGGRLKATNDTPNSTDSDRYFPAINTVRLPFANPPPPRDHELKPINRFFTIGNPRGNENPFLLTFGILWFRYHNFRTYQLKTIHPDWNDEKLFNEARIWTIAVHQKIVMYDWLPSWLSQNLTEYKGYNPHIHPQIAHVFQSAAMRFGHTLVPPAVYRRNAKCDFKLTTNATTGHKIEAGKTALRTCNTFWNPQEAIRESDIDEILMGMASQIAEREDNIITPDLRGNVFGGLDFSRRDLMAVNIQRGRDHGLPDYNTANRIFGLPEKDFDEIITNHDISPSIAEQLRQLYGNDKNNIDIWPAGILETTEGGPGPLFRTIILNQFQRIRDGDRFWFENYKQTKLFTEEQIQQIWNTSLYDVIISVTKIPPDAIQRDVFFHRAGDPCPQHAQLSHLNKTQMEDCTPVKTFDYFSGSEISYTLTILFLLATIIPIIGVLCCLAKRHKTTVSKEQAALRANSKKRTGQPSDTDRSRAAENVVSVSASEWMGKDGERAIVLEMDSSKRHLLVKQNGKHLVRTIDLTHLQEAVDVILSADANLTTMVIRVPKEYDLVLLFDYTHERQDCLNKLKEFLAACGGISLSSPTVTSEKIIKTTAVTKAKRQKILEAFFSEIFAHALKYEKHTATSRQSISLKEASDLVNCELTQAEFAEAFSLRPDSIFVKNMFKLVDTNNNGYISFREFLDFFVVFSKGTGEDKARLMFAMYDLDGSGRLSREEFKLMLRSMVELANEKIEENNIDDLISQLFSKAKLDEKQSGISFEDFQTILRDYHDELNYASLDIQIGDVKAPQLKGKRDNATARARKTIFRAYSQEDRPNVQNNRSSLVDTIKPIERESSGGESGEKWRSFLRYMENYRRQIFWLALYTLVVLGIFVERAYYYSIEREHSGLRRIAGYGVTVTRGAASVMMFTYSSLLVTMCRNIVTVLRETFIHRLVPFDNAISMHKYISFLALLFTLTHIIGHCINFYHISTQTPSDLACLFRNFYHPTDALPKFQRWCWETITGLTGVALTIHVFIIYVFGMQYARRHSYKAFWVTHNSYPIFFILLILHGAGRLVQAPIFYFYFLGPAVLFTIDQLISISRKKIEIAVIKAEILPSDVTYLEIRKPQNFEYQSGQWVRIACLAQSKNEYHPFTLSSAPHEENLTLHIRAVGPWTINIRKVYDPNLLMEHALPKVFLDGPYGEGHQDWSKYGVSILIGGGIGVTPFASILKDIAYKSQSGMKYPCKKVYFIWVTRTQRHFEWMTDILREVEEKDTKNIVSVHVFITQFKEKFDLRTTMLYICERYFQKISGHSLFTGLRSITHFGRPDFPQFFRVIKSEHSDASSFGVFSCGPPPMTRDVEIASSDENKGTGDAPFVHHYENF